MRIVRMKTDHKTNPLGFELEHPFFSWVVESEDTAARRAEAARVEISLAGDFQTLAFDSGRREGLHGFFRVEDFLPEAYTRYYWRVTVWTENGEIVRSEPAWFETAKRNDPWQAKWISPPFEAAVHPYFRREFTLPEDFTRARAYVCGLGLYELEINGQKAGEEYLAPGFHAYDFWLQYQTYDITELLRPGTNAVGAMLGNGWYKGRFGFDGGYTELYGGAFALICELRVERRDGSVLVLGTDGAWMCRESPVLSSGIYDGEVYDAAREVPGWSCAGLDDSGWAPALPAALGTEKLTARHSLPVRVMERRKAALLRTPAGEMVLDFGQNMAGWVEFESALPAGAQIVLQYGEILQGGNFYNDNLRTAKAEFRYISNGSTPLLCRALSENGAHEAAVSLLLQEECPGWLYEVGMGATTVWERWNSVLPDGRLSDTGMNSLNHYAYGSVVEWMYHDLCGIRPSEEAPGFRKATLAPQPDRRLRTARARYDSPAGTWESGWKYIEDDTVAYTFRVPFDTQAAAFLPAAVPEKTRCGTMLLAESGLEYRIYGGGVEVALPSGKWEICVEETGASPHADS